MQRLVRCLHFANKKTMQQANQRRSVIFDVTKKVFIGLMQMLVGEKKLVKKGKKYWVLTIRFMSRFFKL